MKKTVLLVNPCGSRRANPKGQIEFTKFGRVWFGKVAGISYGPYATKKAAKAHIEQHLASEGKAALITDQGIARGKKTRRSSTAKPNPVPEVLAGLGVLKYIEGIFFKTKGYVYDVKKAPTLRALFSFDLPSIVRERYLATNDKRDTLYLIKAGKTRHASKERIQRLEQHLADTLKYYGPAYASKEYDLRPITEKPQRKLGVIRELEFIQFVTGKRKFLEFSKNNIFLWGPVDLPSARDPVAFQQALEKSEMLIVHGPGLKAHIERFTK